LAITCKNSTDVLDIRKKLVAAYITLSTPFDPYLGSFIPANAKYTDHEIFWKLIRRQNNYLSAHHNIPMDGIDDKLLKATTGSGKILMDEILVGAQICRFDSCTTKDYVGRNNFTTTKENFLDSIEWFDTQLPILISTIPA
jgi:hypothetical protein